MPRYRITTPEQVHFHHSIAGLATRAMAWMLDQLLVLLLLGTFTFVSLLSAWGIGIGFAFSLVLIGKLILDFGYFTFFELRWAGQTPGKRRFGIRVISAGGGRLQFTDVIVRTLFRVLDNPFLIPFFGVVGGLVALVDPLRRRLGDFAADTIVVDDAVVALPQGLLNQQLRDNTFQEDLRIRNRVLARVTREERDLMLDLMLRRDDMDHERREILFRDAASYFRERYNLPTELEHLSNEQTVLNLALVIQETKFTG